MSGRPGWVSRSARSTSAGGVRHPPVTERVSTRWPILAFLEWKGICHTACRTDVVALYVARALRTILVSSRDCRATCCGFLIVAMSVLRSPPRMPRLHSSRLSMSGASPMLDSARSPTRRTTFTFGSPDLAVEDAQPYLLFSQSFGRCSLQRAQTNESSLGFRDAPALPAAFDLFESLHSHRPPWLVALGCPESRGWPSLADWPESGVVKRKVASFSAAARRSMLAARVAKTRAGGLCWVSESGPGFLLHPGRQRAGRSDLHRQNFTPPFAGAYEWFYVP